MSWTVGVDVGGTFTDFYAQNEATGAVWLHKRPSTPDDSGRAIVDGLEAFAGEADRSGGDVRRLAHGTAHETAYGYSNPYDQVEVVNFRLTARGRLYRAPPQETVAASAPPPEPIERRAVWFALDRETCTPVYERAALRPGQRLLGPAVIEQLDATTLLFPSDLATVDAASNLLIELAA